MPMTQAQREWKKNNPDKVKAAAQRYREKNLEKIKARWHEKKDTYNANQLRRYYENPAAVLLSAAKVRAKKFGLDFNLELSDIVIPELCPVLKVPLKKGTSYAPSIDRVDNTRGYTKDNIQVISMRANTMKSSASDEELRAFADWIQQSLVGERADYQ
jgi:hypothetical protein